MKLPNKLILSFIFIVALSLRLYGLNWDQHQHLHPDERFLTMVVNDIRLPSNIFNYFSTASSPLNPYNYENYQFFVYGTFPLFLNKITAVAFNLDTYDGITQTGRILSAFFDGFNIILLYFLARKFVRKKHLFFLPSLLYAFTVLPVQLSHFYAFDTFLSFFILAVFTLLSYGLFYPAAAVFGLALASKISAILFIPIILIFFIFEYFNSKKFRPLFIKAILCLVLSFSIFRLFQPYAFDSLLSVNPKFITSLKTLKTYDQPDIYFPPAVQWISKTKLVFPLVNLSVWGLGLPLFFLFSFMLAKLFINRRLFKLNIRQNQLLFTAILWIFFLFIFQGLQFTYAMRYFLPIYPFLIFVAIALADRLNLSYGWIILTLSYQVLSGLAFINIYSRPHSRIAASTYIYSHLPPASIITNEYWDDPLPLYLSGFDPNVYQGIMLPLYDPDTSDKWSKLNPLIDSADYLILSSNRLWGSIPQVPHLYPQTSQFYRDLFNQQLNFQKTAQFISYPGFPLSFLDRCYYFGPTVYPSLKNTWFSSSACSSPGIYFRDDSADESFTVYDHPQVLIFSALKNK